MKVNWLRYREVSDNDLLNIFKRIERAYDIVELNKQEPIIFKKEAFGNEEQQQQQQQLFEVRSCKDKNKFYQVDANIKTCTCPDFNFRLLKCKHLLATEFASSLLNSPPPSYSNNTVA